MDLARIGGNEAIEGIEFLDIAQLLQIFNKFSDFAGHLGDWRQACFGSSAWPNSAPGNLESPSSQPALLRIGKKGKRTPMHFSEGEHPPSSVILCSLRLGPLFKHVVYQTHSEKS